MLTSLALVPSPARTPLEHHDKLKIEGAESIACVYAQCEERPELFRRAYCLLPVHFVFFFSFLPLAISCDFVILERGNF